MSVLVKDMKMPGCCLECPFEDSPEFDSYCIATGYEFIGKWEDLGSYKPDWCPLQDAPTVGEWIPVSDIRKLEDILLMKINSFEGTRNIVEKGMLEVWKEVTEYIDGMLREDGEEE